MILLHLFTTWSLDMYQPLLLYLERSGNMLSSDTLNPNTASSLIMKKITYLKDNIMWVTTLNNDAYHFINPGFTLICRLLHIFGISFWYFSSHRRWFSFSISLLFWMSHWGLWILWIHSSTSFGVSCDRSQIGSLIVNNNITHCLKRCSGMKGNN